MIQHPLPLYPKRPSAAPGKSLSPRHRRAQQRWRGLRVLADGSTGRLPDFLAIEEYFGKPSGSGVPLARFSRLFDVLNDQILHADAPTTHNV